MGVLLTVAGCTEPFDSTGQPVTIECSVSRQECVQEGLVGGGVACTQFAQVMPPFTATICGRVPASPNADCQAKFCTQPAGVAYPYPSGCMATGTDVSSHIPPIGACAPATQGSHLALVSVSRRWRDCAPAQGGAFCSSLAENGNSEGPCLDVSRTPALTQLQPTIDKRERSAWIQTLQVDDQICDLVGKSGGALMLSAGDIGTATANGASTKLTVRDGFITTHPECTSDFGCITVLDRLQANLLDRTVAGAQVSSLTITNTHAANLLNDGTIPPGELQFVARGRVNGVDSAFTFEPHTPWTYTMSAGTLTLKGSLDTRVTNAGGQLVPVTVSVTGIKGTPASAQAKACIGQSPTARLFGFEDANSWSTTNATLSAVTSPVTQGCGALGVAGQGFLQLTGQTFSTSGLSVKPALSVDLFIPGNQPNQFFIGALQMFLSCPSGGVNNMFVGQVELTGKPQNQFSTLRFPLPSQAMSTLQRPLNDCFFGWGLNVNQTNRTWILDNLRFTP